MGAINRRLLVQRVAKAIGQVDCTRPGLIGLSPLTFKRVVRDDLLEKIAQTAVDKVLSLLPPMEEYTEDAKQKQEASSNDGRSST